ncbi:MAG: hypothetical protein K1X55_02380 [Chitinophagales bacterium]|nr:hypothetical protein [Chitinophagales bacterium]
MKRKGFFVLIFGLTIVLSSTFSSCHRGVGCPNDMYNNFNKSKNSNPNGKPPKPKKGGDKGIVPY